MIIKKQIKHSPTLLLLLFLTCFRQFVLNGFEMTSLSKILSTIFHHG